jgi:hypothetical protein
LFDRLLRPGSKLSRSFLRIIRIEKDARNNRSHPHVYLAHETICAGSRTVIFLPNLGSPELVRASRGLSLRFLFILQIFATGLALAGKAKRSGTGFGRGAR